MTMPRPIPAPPSALAAAKPFRAKAPLARAKVHYPDSPLVDKTPFGSGVIGVAPGVVQITAPSGHHFPWTKREALAMAEVLDEEAPRLAASLRAAARACFDKWAGARRSEGDAVVTAD